MIAMLTGVLDEHSGNRGVLDVQGVGYEVFSTTQDLASWSNGSTIRAYISTQVREDSITLYGFAESVDRSAFVALLSVPGIGPKVALSALESLGADGLAQAVGTDDVKALCRIPGVGKKTAQRMAIDLKGKLSATFTPKALPKRAAAATDPLPLALAQLGYTKSEIDRAQAGLDAEGIARDADVGERLRRALALLSGSR